MAFSTAKLREQTLRFISVLQFGQVDCSFFSRLSAKRCVKQDAHIRCPLRHYIGTEKSQHQHFIFTLLGHHMTYPQIPYFGLKVAVNISGDVWGQESPVNRVLPKI